MGGVWQVMNDRVAGKASVGSFPAILHPLLATGRSREVQAHGGAGVNGNAALLLDGLAVLLGNDTDVVTVLLARREQG